MPADLPLTLSTGLRLLVNHQRQYGVRAGVAHQSPCNRHGPARAEEVVDEEHDTRRGWHQAAVAAKPRPAWHARIAPTSALGSRPDGLEHLQER